MQKKINVLLITSYFSPDNHVGAWRWNQLVNFLGKKNYEFYVVAGDNGVLAFFRMLNPRQIASPENTQVPRRHLDIIAGVIQVRRAGRVLVAFDN